MSVIILLDGHASEAPHLFSLPILLTRCKDVGPSTTILCAGLVSFDLQLGKVDRCRGHVCAHACASGYFTLWSLVPTDGS